ncbi:glutamine amidotransferase [Schlesneria sp.]|uniref:glutamine amidotransferase n=1 Tax=Schlesneria sp. TaxID=2762018 RepID=UPI002F077A30
MSGSILYCGDTDLNGAASYLAGMLTTWNFNFQYIPSNQRISIADLEKPRSLLILSDYPAANFAPECQEAALKLIQQGCGLLMIGGWESYHGFGGDWNGTPLAAALPVEIAAQDDRMNFDQSAWLVPATEHPAISGLPWLTRPPAIGGMNHVTPKPDSKVVLEAHTFKATYAGTSNSADSSNSGWSFTPDQKYPALVTGQYGKGRTASFLSDVAPHWVGGFVDWGLPRVTGQAAQSQGIEVGHDYASFWKQLLTWTGQVGT